jgi:hypothetical protein
MAVEKNIRLEPHKSRDLLVSKKSNKKRPKYQPPGGGATSLGSGRDVGGGRDTPDRGGHHPPAQPIAHTVAPTAHYNDRIQNIAAQNQRTRNLRNQAAGQGFHQFLTPRDQTAKKTLGMRLSGLGGLFGALGRGALGFFGGLPGKALSGILTAKNWAKQKGSGVLQGIGEFGDTDEEGNPLYPTWDRYINRNTGKYDDKPYRGQGQSNYTFDDQVATDVVNPNLNNLGVDNQFIEEEQNFDPNFLAPGSAEGGRIGYERGRVVNPGGYQGDIEIPEGFLEGLPNEDYQKMIEELMKQKRHEELMRELGPFQWAADGGIARLL